MQSTPRFATAARLAVIAAASVLVMAQAQAKSDKSFMEDAAHAGAAEIEASKMAQSKSQRADIKSFAETMITEHTQVATELQQLAATKKVKLPDGASIGQKAQLKMLDTDDAAKFDERFVKFGVKSHEDAVKLFQTAAREAKDPEVKAFAQKTLPGLQHHLEMAQGLATKK